jgi:GMP synthase (glutamine-hydrolysing)
MIAGISRPLRRVGCSRSDGAVLFWTSRRQYDRVHSLTRFPGQNAMSRILVFQHVAAEPLGTLDPLIRRRGHRIRFVNFERQPDAQPSMDRYNGLIVLGGPMNVEEQARRPHLRTELEVIDQALAQGKPVLGICLGAQLLAHALGAAIVRNPQSEIGWYDLETNPHGLSDPVLSGLGRRSEVFQWHSRTFELPHGATHLASTTTCTNQAFRYASNAYGFQFHLEMDQAMIERWVGLPHYHAELVAAGLAQDANAIRARTPAAMVGMSAAADVVFGRFLDQIGPPRRSPGAPAARKHEPGRPAEVPLA